MKLVRVLSLSFETIRLELQNLCLVRKQVKPKYLFMWYRCQYLFFIFATVLLNECFSYIYLPYGLIKLNKPYPSWLWLSLRSISLIKFIYPSENWHSTSPLDALIKSRFRTRKSQEGGQINYDREEKKVQTK
jgi:hypothetical protein